MTTDKYGAIVGGTPPIQEDDDENNNHIMDNDADVEGLCFQCLHARHQCHAQAALLWLCNPTAVEGSDCFAMRMIRTKEGGGIQHHEDDNDDDDDHDDNANNNNDGYKGRAALHKVKSTSYAKYSITHLMPHKRHKGTLIHGIST